MIFLFLLFYIIESQTPGLYQTKYPNVYKDAELTSKDWTLG